MLHYLSAIPTQKLDAQSILRNPTCRVSRHSSLSLLLVPVIEVGMIGGSDLTLYGDSLGLVDIDGKLKSNIFI